MFDVVSNSVDPPTPITRKDDARLTDHGLPTTAVDVSTSFNSRRPTSLHLACVGVIRSYMHPSKISVFRISLNVCVHVIEWRTAR